MLHGDEGRGRKHVAHMVLSFRSLLGRGVAAGLEAQKQEGKKRPYAKMLPNFAGHTYTNRFMIASIRKTDYTHDRDHVWERLMRLLADEALLMKTEGVRDKTGKRFWMVTLHVTGDWPFLHKSAFKFLRSCYNVEKHANNEKNRDKGIYCHLCDAGRDNVPFEQVATRRPVWLQTCFLNTPFQNPPPPLTELWHVPGEEAAIWQFDVFHTWHLGLGRNFLGSAIAVLSACEPGSSIGERFESLTVKYKAWCRANQQRAFITKLTKEFIQWPKTSTYPSGSWHRGALTTNLMRWLEDLFENDMPQGDPTLPLIVDATKAANAWFHWLYSSGVWLSPQVAEEVANLGFKFLRRYSELAKIAKQNRACLWSFQPKIHIYHHFNVQLWENSQRRILSLNAISLSCQMDEDFIGRNSRLSRHVTSRSLIHDRVLSRYLAAAYSQWVSARLIIRPN